MNQTSEYLIHCISDCITRWNSSYLAWTRLVQIKTYIQLMISYLLTNDDPNARKDGKRLKDIMLTDLEWDLIIELLQVLGPIEEVTTYLGGSKYTTHSLLYRLIQGLKKRFRLQNTSNVELDFNTEYDAFEDNEFDDIGSENQEEHNNENRQQTQKSKIDTPVNTNNLLNKVKKNMYKALCHYYPTPPPEQLL